MPTLKKYTAFLLLSLAPLAAQAHLDKKLDRNGGHYDYYGDYHCHQPGCVMAPSRYSFDTRTRLSVSRREMELFYNEDDWPYWLTTGGCQDIRTQVLEITSETPVTWTNPRHCAIREGLWIDPYTNEEFTRAAKLEVDHIISPVYANAANGYQWDDQKRAQFANDPLNLIPVGRDIQRKKRDRGIGSWRPPNEEYLCDYAVAWRDVAYKYDLDLFQRDRGRMNGILDDCGLSRKPEISEGESSKDTDVDIRVGGIPVPL